MKIFSLPNLIITRLLILQMTFALFSVFATYAGAQETLFPLPKPPGELRETGAFQGALNKMWNLMKEETMFDFYLEAKLFLNENKTARREERREWASTREEGLAMQYFYYMVAVAPMMSDSLYFERFKEKIPLDSEKIGLNMIDRNLKMDVIHALARDHMDIPFSRKRDISMYKNHHGLSVTPEIFPEETFENKDLHLNYLAYIVKSHLALREQADKDYNAFYKKEFVPTAGYVEPTFPDPVLEFGPNDTDKIRKEKRSIYEAELQKVRELRRKHRDPALIKSVVLHRRHDDLRQGINALKIQRRFVNKIVASFPCDAVKIRHYLALGGFVTDEEYLDVISTCFVRTEESAYLFDAVKKEETKATEKKEK